MFFETDRIEIMQKMILADNIEKREQALNHLLPYQMEDFYKILKTMSPFPVTIRLLDPPLHEFLPTKDKQLGKLSLNLNISIQHLKNRISSLSETNPMLGHRGCRLSIAYPEITEMQSRAIFMATKRLFSEGFDVFPEIMVPLVGSLNEFLNQKHIILKMANNVFGVSFSNFSIGAMIELPRACLIADKIAQHADFISFGTNDLTQTTYGFSRDDINSFLPIYLNKKILKNDPFQSIDVEGVGQLILFAVKKAKETNPSIKIGVCGEHGGDPASIKFFHDIGLDYVSCSPFRVPIALLESARSNI